MAQLPGNDGARRILGLHDSLRTLKQHDTNEKRRVGSSRDACATHVSLTHPWLPRGPSVRWERAELWQLRQRLQQQQCPVLLIHCHLLLPATIYSYSPPPSASRKTCPGFHLLCSVLFLVVSELISAAVHWENCGAVPPCSSSSSVY